MGKNRFIALCGDPEYVVEWRGGARQSFSGNDADGGGKRSRGMLLERVLKISPLLLGEGPRVRAAWIASSTSDVFQLTLTLSQMERELIFQFQNTFLVTVAESSKSVGCVLARTL
ncbi:MAG: hypothetical protein JW959_12075, partial [Pirellulales bacterium]|nr:hypothetical protein [Pirellulales bacterium]